MNGPPTQLTMWKSNIAFIFCEIRYGHTKWPGFFSVDCNNTLFSRKETTGKIFETELLASKYQKGVQVSRKECREWYIIATKRLWQIVIENKNEEKIKVIVGQENWFHLDIISFDTKFSILSLLFQKKVFDL